MSASEGRSRRWVLEVAGQAGLGLLGGRVLLGCGDDPGVGGADARGSSGDAAADPGLDLGPDLADLAPDLAPDAAADLAPDAAADLGLDPPDLGPDEEQPWWLQGNFAPVEDTLDVTDLVVEGRLPAHLDGWYLRNGPNPPGGASSHWFDAPAMVHGVRLAGGQARGYRNRYLETPALAALRAGAPRNPLDPALTLANTALVAHAGRLLALYEAGAPFALDVELASLGIDDFGGALHRPIGAHPKIDPVTGEMFLHSYSAFPPHCVVHRVSPDGATVESREIETTGPSMMHELMLTERFVLVLDLPILFDGALILSQAIPYRWDDDYPARLGLVPRAGGETRWFPIAPCFVFHGVNAFEDGAAVVLDGIRHGPLWRAGPEDLSGGARLYRWRLDLSTGAVIEGPLAAHDVEFPQISPAVRGRPYRFAYGLEFAPSPDGVQLGPTRGLRKYDVTTGETWLHDFGPTVQPDEAVFVPRPGGVAEDDGHLLCLAYDQARQTSALWVFDAQALEGPPVARVWLPRRVPHGFHGLWVPAQPA